MSEKTVVPNLSDFEISMLIIERDTAQRARALLNKYGRAKGFLDAEKKGTASPSGKYSDVDFDKLFWEDLKGAKGPFQRTSKKSTQNHPIFQALQAILKEHKGFVHIGAWKYWFDNQNPEVIDRRKK